MKRARRNSTDEQRRRAERAEAMSGAVDDQARLLVARLRAGELEPDRVGLAAGLGDEAARLAVPDWYVRFWGPSAGGGLLPTPLDVLSNVADGLRGYLRLWGPGVIYKVWEATGARLEDVLQATGLRPDYRWRLAQDRAITSMTRENYGSALHDMALAKVWASGMNEDADEWRGAVDGELNLQRLDLIAVLLERPLPRTTVHPNPRRAVRRNMDVHLRALERAWKSAPGDPEAEAAWLAALVRSGQSSAVQRRRLRILLEKIVRAQWERFVSWQALYYMAQGPRHRRSRRVVAEDQIDETCMEWSLEAAGHDEAEALREFEEEHDVHLTSDQRDQVRFLIEERLQAGCHEAILTDLRRIVERVVKLVNDAAEYGRDEERHEDLLTHLRGPRRPAVLDWHEGRSPDPEQGPGVWFTLTREFLFASRASRLGREQLRQVTGQDVLDAASGWGDLIGEHVTFGRYTEDPSRFVDFPGDEDFMKAVLEAGPLVHAAPEEDE